jgi:hypothetical protein
MKKIYLKVLAKTGIAETRIQAWSGLEEEVSHLSSTSSLSLSLSLSNELCFLQEMYALFARTWRFIFLLYSSFVFPFCCCRCGGQLLYFN